MLLLPVVLFMRASKPVAVLLLPVVFKSASSPRTVLLFVKQPSRQVARASGESAKQASTKGMRKNARIGEQLIEFVSGRLVVFINEPYETKTVACETKKRNSLGEPS